MSQAKTLDERELRRVLDHVATRPHAARNRAMIVMTFYAGLRVGEVAQLQVDDVFDDAGSVKKERELEGKTKSRNEDIFNLLEYHVNLDLEGFEDVGQDGEPTGIKLPYIVTIEENSTEQSQTLIFLKVFASTLVLLAVSPLVNLSLWKDQLRSSLLSQETKINT